MTTVAARHAALVARLERINDQAIALRRQHFPQISSLYKGLMAFDSELADKNPEAARMYNVGTNVHFIVTSQLRRLNGKPSTRRLDRVEAYLNAQVSQLQKKAAEDARIASLELYPYRASCQRLAAATYLTARLLRGLE